MKMRQILIAASTALVVTSPVFAASGSYGEGSMWTDLKSDVVTYSEQSFAAVTEGKVLATETGIYEQLAAEHRMRPQEPQGVAGPVGPTFGEESRAFELRTDASIYERIIAAQSGLADL